MILVDISYEVWGEASYAAGETDESGWLRRSVPFTFKELVRELRGASLSENPPADGPWATVDQGETQAFFERGEREYRSYHLSPGNPDRHRRWWLKALTYIAENRL